MLLLVPESHGLRPIPVAPTPSLPQTPAPGVLRPHPGRPPLPQHSGKRPDPKSGPLESAGPRPGAAASALRACPMPGKQPPQTPGARPAFPLYAALACAPAPAVPPVPTASLPPHSTREEMGHWARRPPALQEQAALQGTGRANGHWQKAE